jgi:hypothetical protein
MWFLAPSSSTFDEPIRVIVQDDGVTWLDVVSAIGNLGTLVAIAALIATMLQNRASLRMSRDVLTEQRLSRESHVAQAATDRTWAARAKLYEDLLAWNERAQRFRMFGGDRDDPEPYPDPTELEGRLALHATSEVARWAIPAIDAVRLYRHEIPPRRRRDPKSGWTRFLRLVIDHYGEGLKQQVRLEQGHGDRLPRVSLMGKHYPGGEYHVSIDDERDDGWPNLPLGDPYEDDLGREES